MARVILMDCFWSVFCSYHVIPKQISITCTISSLLCHSKTSRHFQYKCLTDVPNVRKDYTQQSEAAAALTCGEEHNGKCQRQHPRHSVKFATRAAVEVSLGAQPLTKHVCASRKGSNVRFLPPRPGLDSFSEIRLTARESRLLFRTYRLSECA